MFVGKHLLISGVGFIDGCCFMVLQGNFIVNSVWSKNLRMFDSNKAVFDAGSAKRNDKGVVNDFLIG